ncbi:MAG TPA: SRPBCC family protein [Xanthobacteraceae bacterium]|nr:SRPBCC family protein [Xanthobacteraceae bacterium]
MSKRTVHHGSFTIERVYASPPKRVFAALTSRDAKMRWQAGGEGWETFEFTVDARAGGREVWRGSHQGGPEISTNGLYFDVDENERLISAYEMYAGGTRISVSLATFMLAPQGSGTRVTFTEQGAYFDDPDALANRETGWRELLESLAKEVDG